mgnify:CR=1 FL=1
MSPSKPFAKIAISPGDPAGIGLDITIASSIRANNSALICFTDPEVLNQRIRKLNLGIEAKEITDIEQAVPQKAGVLQIYPVKNKNLVEAGRSDPANTEHILECLNSALWHTTTGITDALVTGPINKAIINEGGVEFSGHTEYLADALGVSNPVMMLASEKLKVALITTHLPIDKVTETITKDRVSEIVTIVDESFKKLFKISEPRICVCGLNPHAGEAGHLGLTDKDVILPTLDELRQSGINISGPIAADSVFSEPERKKYDVIVAMYHDQGLAPLKALSFGRSVNITLGLPVIRTSVDHGTAYELAGTRKADPSSFLEAIKYSEFLASNSNCY